MLVSINEEEIATLKVVLMIEGGRTSKRIKQLESGAMAIDPDELGDLRHNLEQIASMLEKLI